MTSQPNVNENMFNKKPEPTLEALKQRIIELEEQLALFKSRASVSPTDFCGITGTRKPKVEQLEP